MSEVGAVAGERRSIVAVDLFCGAGGLSIGLQQGGIDVAAGIDLDPACRYPFERNVGAKFLKRNVSALRPGVVSDLFGRADIKVLAGCAPCQPFSGYTANRRAVDTRWQLLIEFLRIVKGVQPEVVTLENVPRLVLLPLWERFVGELVAAGYHVAWRVLDAADYGVPQNRRRVVLLASRLGSIALPVPAGMKQTVRSAIGGLPPVAAGDRSSNDPLHVSRALTDRNLARIRTSRQAGTWREWPEEMLAACHRKVSGKTYPSVYGRMSWDQPAPTMTTQFYGFGNGRFGHPEQDRAITLREGAILQSFPQEAVFAAPAKKVNFRQVGRMVGNAVPPALGRAIGSVIFEHATNGL